MGFLKDPRSLVWPRCVSIVHLLSATFLADQASLDQGQRVVETAIVSSIIFLTIVLCVGLCLYVGIGVMSDIQELQGQLMAFRIQETKCFCCSHDHIHPQTGRPLVCDRELIFEAVRRWYGRCEIGDEGCCPGTEAHLERFNKTVQEELRPIVVESIGNGRTCILQFSTLVWAASLPSLVFWLPAYIENKHSYQGYELFVWSVRCFVHWSCWPLSILYFLRIYWLACMLGLRLEKGRFACCSRGLLICFLLPPLLLVGCGLPFLVEFTRAATVSPSLLPLLPFGGLVLVVLMQHLRCRQVRGGLQARETYSSEDQAWR